MKIEVASDAVCPWCYIGKRRLESAERSKQMDERVTAEGKARDVSRLEEEVRELGISAAPPFILERKLGVSGGDAALIPSLNQVKSSRVSSTRA